MRRKIYLTFDCEDFINDRSVNALQRILQLMQKYHLKGLFFLTGHMAEKLINFPDIVDLLKPHEIGYHSSAHSVRPIIVEYTDVKDYELARRISLERERSHVDPLTGKCEGSGGLIAVKNLLPNKPVVSFRAPGLCWSPPHLEALKDLGVLYDFSARLSPTPVTHKEMTFYPSPILFDAVSPTRYRPLLQCVTKYGLAVLDFHPSYFVNATDWDSIFFHSNPERLLDVQARTWKDTRSLLRKFELFLRHFSTLQQRGILSLTPSLEKSGKQLSFDGEFVTNCYRKSVSWARDYFGYTPRFVYEHFKEFFDVKQEVGQYVEHEQVM
jgi:hypothetical protein